MNKKITLLIIAVIVGIITSYCIYTQTTKTSTIKEKMEMVRVVTALKDIKIDTLIKKEMVQITEIPKSNITVGAETDINKVVGKISNSRILKDEPIRKERLNDTQNGHLGSEEREYRIKVDSITYGGAIPGNRVDILWTGSTNIGESVKELKFGSLIYENVLVKKVLNEYGENILDETTSDKYDKNKAKPDIVVLNITQEQAEVLNILKEYAGKDTAFTLLKYTENSKELKKGRNERNILNILKVPEAR